MEQGGWEAGEERGTSRGTGSSDGLSSVRGGGGEHGNTAAQLERRETGMEQGLGSGGGTGE